MGINLKKFIKAKKVDISYFKNKKVGIDVSAYMYRFIAAYRDSTTGEALKRQGNIISHLIGFIHLISSFLNHGITPLFFFDGKAPEIKKEVLLKREQKKRELNLLIEACEKKKEYALLKILKKKVISFGNDEINSLKNILKYSGLAMVQSEQESDYSLASYYLNKKIDYIFANDYDFFIFGVPELIYPDKQNAFQYMEIEQKDEIKKYSQNELIFLSFFLGNDYLPGITGVGPVLAKKELKEPISMDLFFNKFNIQNEERTKYLKVYKLYSSINTYDGHVEKKLNLDIYALQMELQKFSFKKGLIDKYLQILLLYDEKK